MLLETYAAEDIALLLIIVRIDILRLVEVRLLRQCLNLILTDYCLKQLNQYKPIEQSFFV